MKPFFLAATLGIVFLFSCESTAPSDSLLAKLTPSQGLTGKSSYLASPFAAAGDRVYLIGHQDGTFPDLGWHVTGEMGGIWDHPIKLMDGFVAAVTADGKTLCLEKASRFVNFPMASVLTYELPEAGLVVERLQFVPDGEEAVLVEYRFTNQRPASRTIDFTFEGMTDLRPVWLGERTGMVDGPDAVSWLEQPGALLAKDSLNPWFVAWGSTARPSGHTLNSTPCGVSTGGNGTHASLTYPVQVEGQGQRSLVFSIAGSYQSQEKALSTLERTLKGATASFINKQKRYETLANTGRVTVPDSTLNLAMEWARYHTDWLIRDVPEQGRGLSAGLPDYPWWFGCDNEYALRGVLASGRSDIVLSTMDLLRKLSAKTNGNGRIVHEVSTNGAVFNPGNVNETPQFAPLVWAAYCWTGDKQVLETYFPVVKQGMAWLMEENDKDGNGIPDGFGMMEIHGLNSEMIDVATYTWQAWTVAARMAREMGEPNLAVEYEQKARELAQRINTDFWSGPSGSYADFIGTTTQARQLIADAVVRADTLDKPWAVQELKATLAGLDRLPPNQRQGFVVHHNWVVNSPMEAGVADPEKARIALETGSQFVNPFGMFVTGIDRDESAGSEVGSFASTKKIFSYVGAVMTLPTGVQAIGENNYGRPDAALGYLQRMVRSFGYALPGSMYEVSPDFGMMTQAWTIYSLYQPVVGQFFGIEPFAFRKQVVIHPQMPSAWKEARIEGLPVGENVISVSFGRTSNGEKLVLSQNLPDWEWVVTYPAGKYTRWEVDGKEVKPEIAGGSARVKVKGSKTTVEAMKL